MKKAASMFLVCVIMMSFFACSSESITLPKVSTNSASVSAHILPISSKKQVGLAKAEGSVPDFLSAEQKTLYRRAKTAYIEFTLDNSGFGSSSTVELKKNDMTYYKCNGTITKWTDFETAMKSVFTTNYYKKLNEISPFTEHKGNLYYSAGGRGSNIYFVAPETFELISKSSTEIHFYVIGTYDDFAYDSKGNTIVDKQGNMKRAGNPKQEKYQLSMKKGSNGWRFSKFQLAY